MQRIAALTACLSLIFITATASAQNQKIQVRLQARAAKMAFVPAVPAGPATAEAAPSDEDILKKARVANDGKALLEFFRKRTLIEADRDQMLALIRKLGDEEFTVRQKASQQLVSLGVRALPLLREAEKTSTDVEVQRRAEHCRILIEGEAGAQVSAAAARLLAKWKPEGATQVLLNYLPFAEDEGVAEEIRKTLALVGVRNGKTDPVLVQALGDEKAVKRAAAADALCRANAKNELPAVRRLLKDRDPVVRLRAALGLVPFKEKEAVATLIRLLAELDEDKALLAEDMLVQLAEDGSPMVSLGTDAAARKLCSEAWAAWWKTNRDKVDLARVGRVPELQGYTLLVQRDLVWKGGQFQTGVVKEIDGKKKVRWKIDNLMYPVDAELFVKDKEERVLIAEWQGHKVTERDLKGAVKWTYTVANNNSPMSAQRLPNGNTFIAMQNQLLEVDKDSKQVFSIARPGDVMRARKLRNGEVALLTNGGQFIRLDPKTNKVVKQFYTGSWIQQFGTFDVLPSGRVLVPLSGLNKVIEFNPDGKKIWEVTVQWPTSAVRLRNGNTLVASQSTNQVLLFDRKGKVIWQHQADGQMMVARGR